MSCHTPRQAVAPTKHSRIRAEKKCVKLSPRCVKLAVVVHECGHGFQSQTLEQSLCSDSSWACLDGIWFKRLNIIPEPCWSSVTLKTLTTDILRFGRKTEGRPKENGRKTKGRRKEDQRKTEGSEPRGACLAYLALSISRILEFVWNNCLH